MQDNKIKFPYPLNQADWNIIMEIYPEDQTEKIQTLLETGDDK